MKTIEYRVRPLTRYIVTRHVEDHSGFGVEERGEFPNEVAASNAVASFGDSETIQAKPSDVVITRRPMFGYEQVRTWRLGKGWDDNPSP